MSTDSIKNIETAVFERNILYNNASLLTVEHGEPCTFINIGGFECINHKFTRHLLLQILINRLVKKTENRWIKKAARISWTELEKE